jgi:hypothetical protein
VALFCSAGWHESLYITVSIVVDVLYVHLYVLLLFVSVRSNYVICLKFSSVRVKCKAACCLLKVSNIVCGIILFLLYIMKVSSTYHLFKIKFKLTAMNISFIAWVDCVLQRPYQNIVAIAWFNIEPSYNIQHPYRKDAHTYQWQQYFYVPTQWRTQHEY